MKQKTIYVCRECGSISPKWQGRCSSCGTWDSMEETVSEKKTSKKVKRPNSEPVRLGEINSDSDFRFMTGIEELDRVLGGGIVPGSVILVGGDPGIGKSTLMLQMAANLADYKPLYITGEESLRQIKLRADRLADIPAKLEILSETNIESILQVIASESYNSVIIDSIQSVSTDQADATPGSLIQVRECASVLMQSAKTTGTAVFLIGHVTKEGVIAGPKILEHMVDTVLQFEGEKTYSYRILRALKNRYGSTNEIGIFEMSDKGLTEVNNPSEFFLARRNMDDPGVAIVSAIEGSRPILLEVQALVGSSGYNVPQRTATGIENRRLQMILAVLEKRLGVMLRQNDVFINVAGGIYMNDPSLDLGIAAAILSSFKETALNENMALIGELGLTGEVRPVSNIESRIREAEKLGFEKVIIPSSNLKKLPDNFRIKIQPFERISDVFTGIFT